MSFSLQIIKQGKPSKPGLSYNVSFMASLRQALSVANVIDEEASPVAEPIWPPATMKLSEKRSEVLLEHAQISTKVSPKPTPDEQRAIDTYRVSDQRFRTGKPGNQGRVPEYKFESNGRWIVTSKEAKKLADGLTALLDNDDDFELVCDILDIDQKSGVKLEKELARFRDFCGRAALADGFEVG